MDPKQLKSLIGDFQTLGISFETVFKVLDNAEIYHQNRGHDKYAAAVRVAKVLLRGGE